MERGLTRRALLVGSGAATVGALLDLRVVCGASVIAPSARFTNPLDAKVADPCILRTGGVYYLYGTLSLPGDEDGMPVWSSTDLVRWRDHGLAYRKTATTWGQQWFWGPDVKQFGAEFLMYYGAFRSIGGKLASRICVARSTSPTGPFTDVRTPMFDWQGGGDAIDAFCFSDRDGRGWLYFTDARGGRNTIWVAPLSPDRLSLAGEPTRILQPDQPWEVDPVNEGAFVWREGATYLMMFSVNDFRNPAYGMGLASAPSPTGPWTKRTEGPIIRQAPGLRGPGCAGLIQSPDGKETWAYYHVHLQPDGAARQLAISRASIVRRPGGKPELRVEPPTVDPQALPSGAAAFAAPRSDAFRGSTLDRRVWSVVDEIPSRWRIANGTVTVAASDGDMWRGRGDYRNLFLQTPVAGDFDVAVDVSAALAGNYEQVFVIAWQDSDNFVRLGSVYADGPRLSAAIERGAIYEEALVPNPYSGAITLRLRRRGDIWTFEVGQGARRLQVGHPREAPLRLPKPGFGAIAPGTRRQYEARFTNFRFGA